MSAALLVGVLLALGALGYVVMPLFRDRPADRAVPRSADPRPAREVTDEEIETAVRSYRERRAAGVSCAVCGPRPEPDAVYCSACGRRLAG